jgi:NADH-quinone oxidoreductase subunit M
MKPAIAEVVARLEGRQLATVPTDMSLSPAQSLLKVPAIAAPAHAAESHH